MVVVKWSSGCGQVVLWLWSSGCVVVVVVKWLWSCGQVVMWSIVTQCHYENQILPPHVSDNVKLYQSHGNTWKKMGRHVIARYIRGPQPPVLRDVVIQERLATAVEDTVFKCVDYSGPERL